MIVDSHLPSYKLEALLPYYIITTIVLVLMSVFSVANLRQKKSVIVPFYGLDDDDAAEGFDQASPKRLCKVFSQTRRPCHENQTDSFLVPRSAISSVDYRGQPSRHVT